MNIEKEFDLNNVGSKSFDSTVDEIGDWMIDFAKSNGDNDNYIHFLRSSLASSVMLIASLAKRIHHLEKLVLNKGHNGNQ